MKRTVALAALLAICLVAGMGTGPTQLSLADWIRVFTPASNGAGSSDTSLLIANLRLSHVLTAAAVGFVLSLTGAVLQRLLRNPIADPFVLGISSGGVLAAATASLAGLPFLIGPVPTRTLAALCGSILALIIVLCAKRGLRHLDDAFAIPVIGLILNAFFSALLMLLSSLIDPQRSLEIMRWMIGSVQDLSSSELAVALTLIVLLSVILLRTAPAIHALSFGDELGRTIGFHAKKVRRFALICVALLVALSVSVSGSIGFVGLIGPHIARFFVKGTPRQQWIASGLTGSMLVVLADIFARTLLAPTELPIGIFTACIGAPTLAIILLRRFAHAA